MEKQELFKEVKDMIGLNEADKAFDKEIQSYIDSAIFKIMQLGVDEDLSKKIKETREAEIFRNMLVNYIFVYTKIYFDTTTSNVITEAKKDMLKELEWRISVAVHDLKGGE